MSEAVELEPCPFCGGRNITKGLLGMTEKFLGISESDTSRWFARVQCLDCGTQQGYPEAYPLTGPKADDEHDAAIAAWNRRALTGEGEPVAQDAKDAEITRLRADITALEDGNMTWMCDQLDKAKAENAAQAVELERMREAWGFLAPRHYLSLQAVEADVEGEPMQWAVYRESGGRSTRVSQAATPLDAAMLARQALKAG